MSGTAAGFDTDVQTSQPVVELQLTENLTEPDSLSSENSPSNTFLQENDLQENDLENYKQEAGYCCIIRCKSSNKKKTINGVDLFRVKRCCYNEMYFHNYDIVYSMINKLNISVEHKRMILWRIQRIYTKIVCLQKIYKYSYFYSKVFIVIASILSPALTSINTNKNTTIYIYLWWIIWNLQISISLLTSISTFFKWDRNYFLYNEYKDRIEEEVWHYLECTYQYRNNTSNSELTIDDLHKLHIQLFLQNLEHLYSNLCMKDTEIKQSVAFTANKISAAATNPHHGLSHHVPPAPPAPSAPSAPSAPPVPPAPPNPNTQTSSA